ncbi:hypothetical protein HMI55_006690, partial [Coelomomyces lativittatus]
MSSFFSNSSSTRQRINQHELRSVTPPTTTHASSSSHVQSQPRPSYLLSSSSTSSSSTSSTPSSSSSSSSSFQVNTTNSKPNIFRKISNLLVTGKSNPNASSPFRTIYLNQPASNAKLNYVNNHISTAKYNVFTFLFKFLFEQFSNYANLFFLTTALIQQIPDVNPTNPYDTFFPLLFVITLTGIKEILEDIQRHKSDTSTNQSMTRVLTPDASLVPSSSLATFFQTQRHRLRRLQQAFTQAASYSFQPLPWANVQVGHILEVQRNEPFPADLIFLASSEPDGMCYIETKNLDGETNLKIKQARSETATLYSSTYALGTMTGHVHSELPNSSLYTYKGVYYPFSTLTHVTSLYHPRHLPSPSPPSSSSSSSSSSTPPAPRQISFDHQQFLPRGAHLKNTQWVRGLVVSTGHETKLLRNASSAPIKTTYVTRTVNKQIMALCFILFLISVSCAIGSWVFALKFATRYWYLGLTQTFTNGKVSAQVIEFLKQLATFWLLFNNLVPISLIVTIEMVKYLNAHFISNDLNLFYEPTNTPTVVRTSSLVEELGQVHYVFTDKTGTLTCNVMEFKECCIHGQRYTKWDSDFPPPTMMSPSSSSTSLTTTLTTPPEETHGLGDEKKIKKKNGHDVSPTKAMQAPPPPSMGFPSSSSSSKSPSPSPSSSPSPVMMTPMGGGVPSILPLETVRTELGEAYATQSLTPHLKKVYEFFTLLSVCHTVIPDYSNGSLTYQASSPDEAALVKAAGQFGFIFATRKPTEVGVELGDPFSSPRPHPSPSPTSTSSPPHLTPKDDDPRPTPKVNPHLDLGPDLSNSSSSSTLISSPPHLLQPSSSSTSSSTHTTFASGNRPPRTSSPYPSLPSSSSSTSSSSSPSSIVQPSSSHRKEHFQILALNEFNSSRKRMSVLVLHEGRYKLYVKGADNVVMTLLESQETEETVTLQSTLNALEAYASQGLRTLTLAYKELPKDLALQWLQTYQAALSDVQQRDVLLDQVAETIEQGLCLLGVTAVEDKLQDQVPETLSLLVDAKIRVWMLTGDRVETAINIGYSCQLIQAPMKLVVWQGPDQLHFDPLLTSSSTPFALVLDGDALALALTLPGFPPFACQAASVICCRVSPLQKAQVVTCIQRHSKAITLAIGDGANDVSMIQAASIGVGISGLEGMQAAQSADISIAQFRYLSRLLLVHGYFSYTRLTKLILYSFYKNATLFLTQFW